MNESNEKELRALDALIAGALLPEIKCTNPSKDDLDALIAQAEAPLPEDMAALERLGNPFIGRPILPAAQIAPNAVGELAMAMNRKNASDKFSAQTRAELERQAKELLG
jgi:hypothetical protein